MLASAFGSTMEGVYQLFVALLIFAFVIALTYFTTRWIAGYQKKQVTGRNIHILESMRVGGNKLLAIIEAGGEYFLVVFGKDEASLIGRLDGEKLSFSEEEGMAIGKYGSFKEMIAEQLKKNRQSHE